MAIIDPNSATVSSNTRKTLTTGKKILAPVSASVRYTMSNEKYYDIHFVVIHDLEKKDEVGAVHSEKYYIRESHNWRWALLSQCLMYENPFDNEKLDDVQNFLLGNGNRIKVEITEREYNGKTSLQMKNLGKVLKEGKVPPYTDTELQTIKVAEDNYISTCQYRIDQGWATELLPKYQTTTQQNDPFDDNDNDDWDIPEEADNNDTEIPF
tara:strand:- start:7849 stop:8478 length:630 start_codon:yes stop_codon:yes gene_type:complete